MLSLQDIENSYPESIRPFKRFLLREYLQYKILEIIFNSSFANKLCFLGGTCLRIVHHNSRFSEDLDFDNFKLTENDFYQISKIVSSELIRDGYEIEIKNVIKGAYHCYIRFPKVLYNEGLTGHKEEKILIQLDTEAHNFNFSPESYILNKFDVFTKIFTTPLDILLSQKLFAIVNRKRKIGRDFYDVVFMLSKNVKVNLDYIRLKLDINNEQQLKEIIIDTCNKADMVEMAKDVSPFLFNSKDSKKVELFNEYINQVGISFNKLP